MLESQKSIIEHVEELDVQAPVFTRDIYHGCVCGWEAQVGEYVRRFALKRTDFRGEQVHMLIAEEFHKDNKPRKIKQVTRLLVSIKDFDDFAVEAWLEVNDNPEHLKAMKNAVKYLVAKDLLAMEREALAA